MTRLTAQLKDQLEESAKLEAQIKVNLGGWVMSFKVHLTHRRNNYGSIT